jgi:serine/threonine protein kinase
MDTIRTVKESELHCDRYNSDEFIARGGFAEVYRGILDETTNVAVKFYKPLRSLSCLSDDAHDADNDTSFQKEADIMFLLRGCPVTVGLFGILCDSYDHHCNGLVLELGLCTLCDLLYETTSDAEQTASHSKAREPVSLASKLTIMLDAICAIEYTHLHGLSHNDIKPDNFLLFSDGRLKLTDFGLATHTLPTSPKMKASPGKYNRKEMRHELKHPPSPLKPSANAAAGKTVFEECETLALGSLPRVLCKGNTAYQAPELFLAPAVPTPASDVYAFGVLLNEVLTQRKPFSTISSAMLPVQICGGARPTPVFGDEHTDPAGADGEELSECTKRARHLLLTCWEGKAKSRPLASSVLKTVTKLLELEGGERRDEYVSHR